MLTIKNLCIKRQDKVICKHLSLEMNLGECWVVLGKNGAGKTSLLKVIAGLLAKESGDVLINGCSIGVLNSVERARQVGLVLQENDCEFPVSVREFVAHGLYPLHSTKFFHSDKAIEEILQKTALTMIADRAVNTLSGGELKRAALATNLLQSPLFALLDEPLNHLDLQYQAYMLELFLYNVKQAKQGLILSLHDINAAAKYADNVILMWGDGRVSFGAAEDLMTAAILGELYGVQLKLLHAGEKKLFYVS